MTRHEGAHREALSLDLVYHPPDHTGPLVSGEVHLHFVPLLGGSGLISEFMDMLSPDELARARRYRMAEVRERYVICRGLLRVLLGRYLDTPAATVALDYGIQGKPCVAGGHSLQFNLSHTGRRALFAFAQDRALGVDLEPIRSRGEFDRMIPLFFSEDDQNTLQGLPLHAQDKAFSRGWSRKEACIKACGEGLGFGPGLPGVPLMTEEKTALALHHDTRLWVLQDISPEPGYVASLVSEGTPPRLLAWAFRDAEHCANHFR